MKKLLCFCLITQTSFVFASGYCFTNNKKIESCDPETIQAQIKYTDDSHGGMVFIEEFTSKDTLTTTVVYPLDSPVAKKIAKSSIGFKRTSTTYEDNGNGCKVKGAFKETADKITMTPQSYSGSCDPLFKDTFNLTKGKPISYRKINK